MNKVILIGRLTKDPELKFTPGTGNAVCNCTLAVDRKIKNAQGQKEADFISVVIWGKQAENTANYMSKGRLISVCGRLSTRKYEAKDGTNRYVTEVTAEEVQFLDSANKPNAGQGRSSSQGNSNYSAMDFEGSIYEDEMTPIDDGDIPF